jgi:hypothetical protein
MNERLSRSLILPPPSLMSFDGGGDYREWR